METLTVRLKQKARELGFSHVGIARAQRLDSESKLLTEWLGRGFHATMKWMEKNPERRVDPSAILPGARSIVSVAMNYYSAQQHSEDSSAGKVSRYAWGDDYHDMLGDRLDRLSEWLKEQAPNSKSRRYVDTGPVMEKAWAVRAGIGWLGKHTNVITRELGSWVFLGEIITDVELEPDTPIEDFCGTCTACLDACPTGAIVEPYVVDSAKCISYLTIEHRGPIADEFKPISGNWIYGCDICQDVCPWNRFQQPTPHQAFEARPENVAPRLEELSVMTQEEFSRRFKNSPMKRTKLEGLKRNARAILDTPAPKP